MLICHLVIKHSIQCNVSKIKTTFSGLGTTVKYIQNFVLVKFCDGTKIIQKHEPFFLLIYDALMVISEFWMIPCYLR